MILGHVAAFVLQRLGLYLGKELRWAVVALVAGAALCVTVPMVRRRFPGAAAHSMWRLVLAGWAGGVALAVAGSVLPARMMDEVPFPPTAMNAAEEAALLVGSYSVMILAPLMVLRTVGGSVSGAAAEQMDAADKVRGAPNAPCS